MRTWTPFAEYFSRLLRMADELTVECRRLEWRHDVAARGVQHLVAVARNPAAEQPLLQAKQGTKRNERIKETIGLDNRCKMPLINKYGAVRASTRLPDFSQHLHRRLMGLIWHKVQKQPP